MKARYEEHRVKLIEIVCELRPKLYHALYIAYEQKPK